MGEGVRRNAKGKVILLKAHLRNSQFPRYLSATPAKE